MKKIDLVHLTLIIIAILSGYSAVEYLMSIMSLVVYLGDSYSHFSTRAISFLIYAFLYGIVCISLVANGRNYAAMLLKEEPEGSWEDAPRWDLDRRNMLFVLFIGLGLYIMIESAATLLEDCYQLFNEKAGQAAKDTKPTYLVYQVLRFVFGACLVYAAPTLTNFIEEKIAVRLDSDPASK